MRTWLILGALMCSPLLAAPVQAEDQGLEERLQQLEKAIEELKKQEQREQQAAPPMPGQPQEPEKKTLRSLTVPRNPDQHYGSTMQGSGGLIYSRPFVASPKAIVGGYAEIAYVNHSNNLGELNAENGNQVQELTGNAFQLRRMVPFIYADVSENVKFATEIEFENGGEEIDIEFATIDYLIQEFINLRAGDILLPVGKFNLLHDSPLRDLTDRPLVDQYIIPVALHQAGAGIYGTLYPTRLSKLDYELYVTNGFSNYNQYQPSGPSGISPINPIQGTRGVSQIFSEFDNNTGKAGVGRIAFSPFLGLEIGGSGIFGAYDPASKRPLAIWALDWTVQRGPFELIGESAWGYVSSNNLYQNGTPISSGNLLNPRRMQGYYIQGNYHFLPAILTQLAPSFFNRDVSTLTAVVRWEEIHLAQDLSGRAGALGDRQRLTLGLNFRPTEDTVFKFDFQYTPEDVAATSFGVPPEDVRTLPDASTYQRVHDTAFLASWATYF